MHDGHRELDVPESLAAHGFRRHLDAAAVADDAFVANAFVFSAIAFPIARRAKDFLAKESIFFRAVRAVVDRLRFRHLAVTAVQGSLRTRKPDRDLREIVK